MHSRTTAASLTESRIRKILDLHDHLRQKTRKDAKQFFKDRDRLLMIFHAIKAGGVDTLIEGYTRAARGDLIRSGIEKLKTGGLGNPAAAEEMLRQATGYAEKQVRQLETIGDAEVLAVSNCLQEIEGRLFGRLKKIRR